MPISIIDEQKIFASLEASTKANATAIRYILDKAITLQGLSVGEAAVLASITDPELLQEIFAAAKKVKEEIYGKRLVIFAPLYISNLCENECLYCAFRSTNKGIKRRFLTQEEIAGETSALIGQGHKRLLLLAGESYPHNNFRYIIDSIETVYSIKCPGGEIRRLNVEIAPLTMDEFKLLKAANIGTYIVFQETYHRETYKKMHLRGKKADYDWRISVFDRAMSAGIGDVGLGALFGLYDWRFEMLALLQHAEYLSNTFGVGPHTISVPRLEPAAGSEVASNPLYPVSDADFCKLVAILRLAVPYTGIIMSTRESPEVRRATFELGVSQISAGSRTSPGGYSETDGATGSQFCLGDHRSLSEVVQDIVRLGYLPSFCTACYRLGRVGIDFMDLAKTGRIKDVCAPNALLTFEEFLLDHATPETRQIGEQLIQKELDAMPPKQKAITQELLSHLKSGKRDLYL
jgi:2-iminoacetate synthase